MAPKRSYSRIAGLSVVGVLVVVAIGAWLLATPSDEYVLLPDDPHPADAVVSVGGAKPTIALDGSGIYYLDVLVHRASLPESWIARFEDGADVVPASAIVPPGGSPGDLDRIDHLTFQDSRIVAGVVALRALGRKVTVTLTGVTFDAVERSAPAWAAGLRAGMVITAVDGVPTPQLTTLRTQLEGRKPGSPVSLTVRDGSRTRELQTRLTSDPQERKRAIVGVLGVHDAPPKAHLPVRVTITPRGLGRGPSAGLAFTLEVYDAASGHHLAQGRKIAVTGTIDLAGRVGPIGGVRQKVLGAVRRHADLVLVPDANAADARAAARGRVKVIPVSSFREALAALGAQPAGAAAA
ncbi:MAG TPA: S16 family serine protease [Solirubrobacteraceae bacterium]|nr:S16 family serine protease [Solirubrobacteraceae bacterium]